MKRNFAMLGGSSEGATNGIGSTPRAGRAGVSRGPGTSARGKRVRQTSMRAFLCADTPTETPTHPMQPTLHTNGSTVSNLEWPSTAQRALENLRVGTPAMPSIGPQVLTSRAEGLESPDTSPGEEGLNADVVARPGGIASVLELRPAPPTARMFDICDDDDDGFRILSSQTYHRPATQQEDTNSSWADTWLPADIGTSAQQDQTARPSWLDQSGAVQGESVPLDGEDVGSILTQNVEESRQPDHLDEQCLHKLTPPQVSFGACASQAANFSYRPSVPGNTSDQVLAFNDSESDMMTHAVTPELVPVQMHQQQGDQKVAPKAPPPPNKAETVKPPLAAMFRPRSQRKMLLVVRHGESEYNRAVQESKSYADPMIFDPHLTARGVAQCKRLKEELAKLLADKCREFGEPVWIVSPLTRALQTFLLSCPYPDRIPGAAQLVAATVPVPLQPSLVLNNNQQDFVSLQQRQDSQQGESTHFVVTTAEPAEQPSFGSTSFAATEQGRGVVSGITFKGQLAGRTRSAVMNNTGGLAGMKSGFLQNFSSSSNAGSSPAQAPAASQQPLKVTVLSTISEFMATPGDVGRPPAHLMKEFPELADQLAGLPEVWWHHVANTPNSCALTKHWAGCEPTDRRKQRVTEFCRWLEAQQERLFVMVGHSSFWHQFMGKQQARLKNCEVVCMSW